MTRLVCCVCAIAGMARAAEAPPDWQTVRSLQPAGLVMKLTLPKSRYFLGELIDGKIEITNNAPSGYTLSELSLSRAGRALGLQYYAADNSGKPVPDPLAWIEPMLMMGQMNGMSREYDLGHWSMMLPTVYSVRFDQPGKYTIWAWTNRPIVAASNASPSSQRRSVELVSNKVAITIEPRTAAEETQAITDAQAKLADPKQQLEGALELNALQTPQARAVLRTLISDNDNTGASNVAEMGLAAAPDPKAEAAALLDDVARGKITVGRSMQWVYSWLERGDKPEGPGGESAKEHTAAFERILRAAQQASGGHGPAYAETLWVEYQGLAATDPKWPAARAALVAHQLELSQTHKDEIVLNWFFDFRDKARRASLPAVIPSWKGSDFLPLAREALTKPPLPFPTGAEGVNALSRDERSKNYARQRYHSAALAILANEKPDEARPIIVADLQRDEPVYFGNGSDLTSSNGDAIPVVPMPELDSTFRTALASKEPSLARLICLIAQYGTAGLEHDVLTVYTPNTYEHDSTTRDGLVKYFKRCDPAKADSIPKQ